MDELKRLMLGPPRLWLSVAESVTCGRLQARIGAISGALQFFAGGITAYTLDQKARHLGVDRVSAAAVDSVSGGVAEQMARGACVLFDSDIGVATTGYAEPSAERGIADPFAWWAVARRREDGGFAVDSGRVDCRGCSRTEAQELMAAAAAAALVDCLNSIRR
jgi:nicotinamide-nucleotide amidase